ncbi:lipase/acyltransferase domain-containing protein [Streptomyces nojiriensis]|uniref:lipase/acyltransferase domain-containing protein n=1 Tax=Streptomyces nojiriensis TaxID=66374 RepID=UPI0035DD47D5
MARIPMADVVVLLPGIGGSVLTRNGKDVWAPSASAVLGALASLGGSLESLELGADDWLVDDLGDGVAADRLVPDLHTLPGLWKIDGYTAIEKFLLARFDLQKGRNYFPFPYDWRRDNRAAARRLADQSAVWLRDWRGTSGNSAAQLVLIGHSMGGLVSRYFVEVLGGWKDTRAIVTFGTPYYGSLNAVEFLCNGFHKRIGPFEKDLTRLLRSFTGLHQLAPVYRCVYGPDGEAATPAKAGLPGWQPQWSSHLTDFFGEMEKAAADNRKESAWESNQVVYHPIVGMDQPTRQSARLTDHKVETLMLRGDEDEGGDGTVPKLSAALSGTEDARTFVPQKHGSLQNHDAMLDHLGGILQSLHDIRIDDLRAAVTSWFSYLGDDLYLADEPVVCEVGAISALSEGELPEVPARLSVTDRASGRAVVARDLTVARERQRVDIGVLPAGTYDLLISAGADTAPLSDVFVVAGPDGTDAVGATDGTRVPEG